MRVNQEYDEAGFTEVELIWEESKAGILFSRK
jgi:hypothetical protein